MSKHKLIAGFSIILAIILTSSFIMPVNQQEKIAGSISPSLTRSNVITILDDTGLALQASSGTGTAGDPYIIEDLLIEGNETLWGILVQNTRAYATFRNIFINETTLVGAGFLNVSNVLLDNVSVCHAGHSTFGIGLVNCTNVNATNCNVSESNFISNAIINCHITGLYIEDGWLTNQELIVSSPSINLHLQDIEIMIDNASLISQPSVFLNDTHDLQVENLTLHSGGVVVFAYGINATIKDFTRINATYQGSGMNMACISLLCTNMTFEGVNMECNNVTAFGLLSCQDIELKHSDFELQNFTGDFPVAYAGFESSNLQVENCTFRHGDNLNVTGACFFINVSQVMLKNNTFHGLTFACGGDYLNDTTIQENLFEMCDYGLYITNASNGNITVTKNLFHHMNNASIASLPAGANVTNNAYWDYFDQTGVDYHDWEEGDILPVAYNASTNETTILDTEPFYSVYLFGETDYLPVASFYIQGSPAQLQVDSRYNFIFNGSQGDLPATFQWDFGDSSDNSTLQNPDHIYGESGYYWVTLTIIDAGNETSTYQIRVRVILPAIHYQIEFEVDNVDQTITMTYSVDNSQGSVIYLDNEIIATYTSDQDETTILTSKLQVGIHEVRIEVIDLEGGIHVYEEQVTIEGILQPFAITFDNPLVISGIVFGIIGLIAVYWFITKSGKKRTSKHRRR